MSVRLMSLVFERYPEGGGEMLLALAIADHADDAGQSIYPSIQMLAAKTRQSERTVQYQLRRMEQAQWLLLVNAGNGGRGQRREYRINPEWLKGADIAPLEPVDKPGNGAIHSVKDAETAPLEDEKGAGDDTKGAIHDIKGANGSTKGCNPLHPHITVIESPENRQVTIKKKAVLALPVWLPDESWNDWVAHRKAVKAPLTDRAAQLCLGKLEKFHAAGYDVVEIINQSVMSGKWTDLYAPKNHQAVNGHNGQHFNRQEALEASNQAIAERALRNSQ